MPYTVEVLIPHNYHCSSSFMYKYYIYETNIYSQLSSLHKGLSFLPLHNQKKNTVLQEENYLILSMNFRHKVGIRDDAPLLWNSKCQQQGCKRTSILKGGKTWNEQKKYQSFAECHEDVITHENLKIFDHFKFFCGSVLWRAYWVPCLRFSASRGWLHASNSLSTKFGF